MHRSFPKPEPYLDDYDATDLTIRVIDQMRKQSGWEPLPRDIRETYAPWTLKDNGVKKEGKAKIKN